MKKISQSLDCTAQGSKDAISGASYATVTGYLAPGNGTSINSSTPALDNTDVTAAGAQGVGFQSKIKMPAMQFRLLPMWIKLRK